MKSLRKPRPSYILVAASAAQLSLTGCYTEVKADPSCSYSHSPACRTVNPAPIHWPDPSPAATEAGFIYQIDFDRLTIAPIGPEPAEGASEAPVKTIKKEALPADQTQLLKSLQAILDVTKLSCAPDAGGVAYRMELSRNLRVVHTVLSRDGYCEGTKDQPALSFVEPTALWTIYRSQP